MNHANLGQLGGHRAMQAMPAELIGTESLDELTFQQLLDLSDEASEDDSLDTFNDVARELKVRRDEAKAALATLFVAACRVGAVGMDTLMPRTVTYNAADDGQADRWAYVRQDKPLRWFLREFSETKAASAVLDALLVTAPELLETNRDLAVRRVAREYAEAEFEGLLRAGWLA